MIFNLIAELIIIFILLISILFDIVGIDRIFAFIFGLICVILLISGILLSNI